MNVAVSLISVTSACAVRPISMLVDRGGGVESNDDDEDDDGGYEEEDVSRQVSQ
uniref:Uncharacterized protein n=1 Tax=Melanopsichium pennsylvanicum 4 TaxID=1398559 RepID=A0A077R910_9BASI|nr:uncharacterized protein BN887_06122 [Melanopsichium pennsylvanicum 4]